MIPVRGTYQTGTNILIVENRGQHRNGEAQWLRVRVPACNVPTDPNLPRRIFFERSLIRFPFLSILHYQIGSRVVINLGRKAQAARGKVNMLDARLPSAFVRSHRSFTSAARVQGVNHIHRTAPPTLWSLCLSLHCTRWRAR